MIESGSFFPLMPSWLKLVIYPGRKPAVYDYKPSPVFIPNNLFISSDGLSIGIDHPVRIFILPDHAVTIFLICFQPKSVYIVGILYPLEAVAVSVGNTIAFKPKGVHPVLQLDLQLISGLHGAVIQLVRGKEIKVRLLNTIYIPLYEILR